MSSKFQNFQSFLRNPRFETSRLKLKKVVDDYTFLDISEKNESELNFEVNIKESKVIIVSHYEEQGNRYFVVSFKRTVLVIKETKIKILQSLLTKKENLKICFLSNTKEIFDDVNSKTNETEIKYEEITKDENFQDEIHKFNSNFFRINTKSFQYNDILQIIKSSISGFLIKQSYYANDRINNYDNKINKKIKPREITDDEIVELRTIGEGNDSHIYLYYHIEYEKLVVIKKYSFYNSEIEKLLKREIENYTEINHPFMPKFYGTIKYDDFSYPVIEFINGKTLLNTDLSQFSKTEIHEIILQMILVFKYLHTNHFIYRDLKPNNIMIDENYKTLILIDFDRMVKDGYTYDENAETADFSSKFAAPEINSKDITNKCDIYSIGKMIDFIINEAKSMIKNFESTKLFQIYCKCIKDNAESRPNIHELFNIFYFYVLENNDLNIDRAIDYYSLATNLNIPQAQYKLGLIYEEGRYIPRDMNKSIQYFSLAANQNISEAQYNLGMIYYEGKYVLQDINKCIYFLSLAANQNDSQAQYNLGIIYEEGQYISRDINKSIHYYSLAVNQNNPEAQFNLGIIYYSGQYVSRDINKAIYYFKLAADQNHTNAQFLLGLIFYNGQFVSRDIDKAIYYFKLAADQKDTNAQFLLGLNYYAGQFIPRDINKSIYYYSLAANQNHPQAQRNLGLIYYTGFYIPRDINKSIYFFEKAANQNDLEAQYNLGVIYYSGLYISRDINKALYYYSLAANQNHPKAQFNLGVIYSENQYIQRNMDKALYYYSLAANQNISEAQYNLGMIYYEGKYVLQDINKCIYFLLLAANQNDPRAQYNLGLIYHKGQYISRDMNKSIYYYSLAANQNDPRAQFQLGLIYHTGQYIPRDINKSIYYYSLAANQNIPEAQYNLGFIYSDGKYVPQDINKSIHYCSLAANQNIPEAQYRLGFIYSEGKYVPQDINKSIHYYSLAANQNISEAQYRLGFIYSKGKYVPQDIRKSIHYYSLASNQNHPGAQFDLGLIYLDGRYVQRDINKSIHYYLLAANQNYPEAQYILGLIYYHGIYIKQNIKRGVYWITQSSNNDCIQAQYALGFLYQEGKYIKRNIEESINLYKKASSFNYQYNKNNLGIICKKYFENKYDYTVYFEEAILQKNDPVSMYNLSHDYIYKYKDDKLIKKSIKLLIKSSKQGFIPSKELLCIIIIKELFDKYLNEKINIEIIKQELIKITKETSELLYTFINIIQKQQLYDQLIFEYYYKKYEEIEFIYDLMKNPICIKDLYNGESKPNLEDSNEKNNITIDFYEGFE